MASEFPKFKLVEKEQSNFMKFLNFFVQLWNSEFLTKYTTVLGYKVYMPKAITDSDMGYEILRHEAVHMRQWRKWWILQPITYAILPIGPSFRAYWEFQGYVESMRALKFLGWPITDAYIEAIAKQFYGSAYLFMWPFPNHIRNKLKEARDKILNLQ